MSDIFAERWFASDYMDDEKSWGVISSENVIVIGHSAGLTQEQCQRIARYHNDKILNASAKELHENRN